MHDAEQRILNAFGEPIPRLFAAGELGGVFGHLYMSGGNLAECYMHGLELIIEAARQVRGTSTCQVKDAEISMVVSGPMVAPVSDLILRG